MNDYEFQVHITELIEKEDIEQLEKEIGCDKELLNKKTFVGSWMDIAAGFGKEKVIRYLIEKGIDRSIDSSTGNALASAAGTKDGNIHIMEILMNYGYKINCELGDKNPAVAVIGTWDKEKFLYLMKKEKELLSESDYQKLKEYTLEQAKIMGAEDIKKELVGENDISQNVTVDKSKLTRLFVKGLEAAIRKTNEQSEYKDIYIYSLSFDQELIDLYVFYNSREWYNEVLELEEEGDEFYYKYCEDEWPSAILCTDCMGAAFEYLHEQNITIEEIDQVYEALADAIVSLKKSSGTFNQLLQGKIVTVYGHEYCDEDLFIKLVKKMNDKKLVEEYIKNMRFFY